MPTQPVSRRTFLKLGATTVAATVLAGCQAPRRPVMLEPYVKPPEEQLTGQATWYASTCRQCPAGCGIVVRVMNGRALKIEGNSEHPLNRGKLCARGQAGLQLLYNPDRLSGPVQQAQRGSRQFAPVAWNDAINTLFTKVQAAGPAVGVWAGTTLSGHIYDLYQQLAKALNAAPPVVFDLYTALHGYATLGRVNQTLAGRNELPAYDISRSDVILSFGADFLGTWLSAVRYGVDFGSFRSQALGKRGYLVQLEPRMSITGAKADRWVPLQPGAEALVAQAILSLTASEGYGPAERMARAQVLAGSVDVNAAAAAGGLSLDELKSLARLWATADRPVALPGSALTGAGQGEAAASAVQALNVAAGAGGLPLASSASMPNLTKPGVSTFADAQALIARMQAGKVPVLLVHGANPLYDLPAAAGFGEALKKVPYVVSFAPLVDETAAWADLILPDRTYLESWGYEVVSPNFGQAMVSSQQPVVVPVFDARAAGDILVTLGQGLNPAGTPWADEVAFLKDSVSRLADKAQAEATWARFLQHGGWWASAVPAVPAASAAAAPAAAAPAANTALQNAAPSFQGDAAQYPNYLHLYPSALLSDGRGANLPWLQGSPDPMTTVAWQTWVELNPDTAQKLGVTDGDIVRVTSPSGELEAPVYVYPAVRPDTVAIPTGQGHADYGRYARGRGGNPLQLIGLTQDAAGQALAWAGMRVKVTPTGRKAALALFEFKAATDDQSLSSFFPG
jgi:anaerobic selenocysteine-containing dehydrogenase